MCECWTAQARDSHTLWEVQGDQTEQSHNGVRVGAEQWHPSTMMNFHSSHRHIRQAQAHRVQHDCLDDTEHMMQTNRYHQLRKLHTDQVRCDLGILDGCAENTVPV